MLLVTKRRQVGSLCGHAIYTVGESRLITVPHPSVQTPVALSKTELRYKKLLQGVDLNKDFFFSYTYRIMQSVQRNEILRDDPSMPYENMFVWNAFLSRGIRQHLKSTRWTVALMHGFFEQANFSSFGRLFSVFLISRRSRHFAGTRYLKRGVNDKGRVANDVETEQIVVDETGSGPGYERISSAVQVRGSIPLFWSQEASRLNAKPDIHLQRFDPMYQATKLHFEDLENRYGNPITILNLIKTVEKRPREMMLRREFATAVGYLNSILPKERRLNFIHWDFHKYAKSKAANVIAVLGKVANDTLDLTDMYYSGVPSLSKSAQSQRAANASTESVPLAKSLSAICGRKREQRFQSGVLRTNCIDCLDRTNVAQYAFGLAAVGRQLHAVGLSDSTAVDMNGKVAETLMVMYHNMGDVLALQYGGSPAHNTVFPERQGKWIATTQSREILNSIKRYYSNTYTDGDKQDAMNLFLGHFRPQEGKPALWELDSDYYLHVAGCEDELSKDDKIPLPVTGVKGTLQAPRKMEGAMPVACRHPDDYHCSKLTSFDKLLQVNCASQQSIQPCGELQQENKEQFAAPWSTPDAVEVLLKSPNWLFGSKNQEHPAPAIPSSILGSAPDKSEDTLEQELDGLDWMSFHSPFADEELYDRYLFQGSSEDDTWYGTGILPGTVDNSEANRHYTQLCKGPSLESLISETNYDRDYHSVTGPTYLSDEEAVALSMETALNQLNNVGVEYGSITPEAAKSFYIFSRESL
nr:phosphoinositide phosphatase SAC1-like isoform X3 [Physcomitrium patens]|eukprot:XP_024397678.1 phosphoinositide phosphatase SAC1-like isoform X3 [Physcomitrella patens]